MDSQIMNTMVVSPNIANSTVSVEMHGVALNTRNKILVEINSLLELKSPEQRDALINLVRRAKAYLDLIESQRVELKKPALELGRAIDKCAKEHCAGLLNAVQSAEIAIAKFNSRLDQQIKDELKRLEECEKVASKEGSIESVKAQLQADEIKENLEAIAPVAANRQGVSKRESIKVNVVDVKALYAARPDCVKLVPDITQITYLARRGVELPGVEITRVERCVVKKS